MSECNCECKLVPVNDRLVIQKIGEAEKSAGGLYMPENKTENTVLKGKVIAAGPGMINQFIEGGSRIPMPAAAGDMILFAGYQGQTVEVCGQEYVILAANDVLCVIKEN